VDCDKGGWLEHAEKRFGICAAPRPDDHSGDCHANQRAMLCSSKSGPIRSQIRIDQYC
jgi:hypothetical protein